MNEIKTLEHPTLKVVLNVKNNLFLNSYIIDK